MKEKLAMEIKFHNLKDFMSELENNAGTLIDKVDNGEFIKISSNDWINEIDNDNLLPLIKSLKENNVFNNKHHCASTDIKEEHKDKPQILQDHLHEAVECNGGCDNVICGVNKSRKPYWDNIIAPEESTARYKPAKEEIIKSINQIIGKTQEKVCDIFIKSLIYEYEYENHKYGKASLPESQYITYDRESLTVDSFGKRATIADAVKTWKPDRNFVAIGNEDTLNSLGNKQEWKCHSIEPISINSDELRKKQSKHDINKLVEHIYVFSVYDVAVELPCLNIKISDNQNKICAMAIVGGIGNGGHVNCYRKTEDCVVVIEVPRGEL